jgi:two-component system cell cycle response regulator
MPGDTIRVLLVEDNPGDASLICAYLSGGHDNFQITHIHRLSEAIERLAQGTIDVVLLDLGLPDSQGLATLRELRRAAGDVPIVVLTDLDDERLAIPALQEGALDYLVKRRIEERGLMRALRYAIERQRLQVETESLRKEQLALKDEFLSHVSHELRCR